MVVCNLTHPPFGILIIAVWRLLLQKAPALTLQAHTACSNVPSLRGKGVTGSVVDGLATAGFSACHIALRLLQDSGNTFVVAVLMMEPDPTPHVKGVVGALL